MKQIKWLEKNFELMILAIMLVVMQLSGHLPMSLCVIVSTMR